MTDDQRTSAEPLSAWLGRVHAHLPAQVPELTPGETQALLELADDDLRRLFEHSQPGETSPEAGYTPGPAARPSP